jgi:hypothetical protein
MNLASQEGNFLNFQGHSAIEKFSLQKPKIRDIFV